MYYIVGLGNPGKEHMIDRHNVGWMMLDALVVACALPQPVVSAKYAGRISEGLINGVEVALLYPETFMNNSGSAVRNLVPKGEEGKVVVIYDDVDIPLGEVKISVGRGAGGHNGVASLISKLGTKDFIRVRVGVAGKTLFGTTKRPTGARLPQYVLGEFKKKELAVVAVVGEQMAEIITTLVTDGVTAAMNRYN